MSEDEHFLLPVASALESETGKAESELGTLPGDDLSGVHSPAALPVEVLGRDDDFWAGRWLGTSCSCFTIRRSGYQH